MGLMSHHNRVNYSTHLCPYFLFKLSFITLSHFVLIIPYFYFEQHHLTIIRLREGQKVQITKYYDGEVERGTRFKSFKCYEREREREAQGSNHSSFVCERESH